MFKKLSRTITILIIFVVSICSIAGVSATWKYAVFSPDEVNESVKVDYFPWEGSDILPEDEVGYNHRVLIENIINGSMTENGVTTGIGLNNPDSELNQQLENRENRNKTTFGSMDAWDSAEMHAIFGLEASELAFMIYSPANQPTVKYIYTTSVELGESSWFYGKPTYPIGTRIYPVYRTKVNGVVVDKVKGEDVYEWTAEKTVLGSAKSQYYDNDYLGSFASKNPAFNPTTFAPMFAEDCETGETPIAMGQTTANAIYTYVGQSFIMGTDKVAETAYFTIQPTTAGTVKITPDNEGLTIVVYSNANYTTEIASSTETGIATFTATANTTYYYKVMGTSPKNFIISQ